MKEYRYRLVEPIPSKPNKTYYVQYKMSFFGRWYDVANGRFDGHNARGKAIAFLQECWMGEGPENILIGDVPVYDTFTEYDRGVRSMFQGDSPVHIEEYQMLKPYNDIDAKPKPPSMNTPGIYHVPGFGHVEII